MIRIYSVVIIAISQFLFFNYAKAQQYSIDIAGTPVTCTASNGQLVPIYFDQSAALAAKKLGGARADYTPKFGYTIAMDLNFLNGLPTLGVFFTFYHECAHVALPMGVGLMSPLQEKNADCYAIKSMKYHGLIRTWSDFRQAMSAVIKSGGGHYVDIQRIKAMSKC